MNTSTVKPVPDPTEIASALAVLFDPNAVVELRAISTRGRKHVDCGYYDDAHREDLIREATRLNKNGSAVYVTLNAIDPQLLARYANRIEERASTTTTDANVIRRRWLLIDYDPVRPKDTSATDAQLDASKALARECFQALRGEGWPDPAVAWSGNGVHLLYPIDLPNDPETTEVIKGALQGLAKRFDTDAVKLDQSVFNAGRIVKLYGTVANKGDHTPETPWRLSRIMSATKRETIVTLEQLRVLAPPTANQGSRPNDSQRYKEFGLDAFLGRLGVGYTQDTHNGRERYKLARCPFNPEHGAGEAAVFRAADGTLGFKCQHDSCVDRHWADLREMVDGAKQPNNNDSRPNGEKARGNGASGDSDWQAAVERLAKLSPIEYDRVREEEAKALKVRVATLDKAVKARRGKRGTDEVKKPRPQVTCPELADPDPLILVDKAIGELGYGGDRKLPRLLYLCFTSRLVAFYGGGMLAHAQVVGGPAGGKNYTVDTALALLPADAYLKIDAGTPKALIYSDEDLQHRIVVFTEADSLPISDGGGKSLADGDSRATAASALRNLCSDGFLSFDVVERGEDGQFVTRHIRKPGPTLLMTTTTKAIGGQMGTRLWEIPIKETDEQINAALGARVQLELTRQRANPDDLVSYQNYLQSKAPWDVIVPFVKALADGLVYIGMNPRILRDFQRLLALIKSVTILRHKLREKDDKGRLIATLDDYDAVRQVLNECYSATVDEGLTDDVRLVVGAVKNLRDSGELAVTYLKVSLLLNWNVMRVRRKAVVAMKHGWLINKQEKPRQPANLDVGEGMPKSRGLPEAHTLHVIPSQNDCERVNASIGAGSGVNTTDNTDNTRVNSRGANVNDNEAVNTPEANETAALTRQQPFRGGNGGVHTPPVDDDAYVEVDSNFNFDDAEAF